MTVDDRPHNVDALAGDDVVELFGWPVTLLDEIRDLSCLANRGEIEIGEWRRRDAELRAAGPAESPHDQIGVVHKAAMDAWRGICAEPGEAMDRMLRLTRRLDAALRGAPDDEDLREQLSLIDELLSSPRDRDVRPQLQEDRELVTWWLACSTQLDHVTGLPWDYLARYRWLPDPALGRVPAFLDLARWRALREAPAEMTHLARQLRPEVMPYPAMDEVSQHALTRFPSRVIEAAGNGDKDAATLAVQVLHLWQSKETQRFLLRETARGWPENLRQPDPLPH